MNVDMRIITIILTAFFFGLSTLGMAQIRNYIKRHIHPSKSEYYCGDRERNKEADEWREYDVCGNLIKNVSKFGGETEYSLKSYDNSKGYPVLMSFYYYIVDASGKKSDVSCYDHSLYNNKGVRIGIEGTSYRNLTFDSLGHVLSFKNDISIGIEMYQNLTWKGDTLVALKYGNVNKKRGTGFYMHWDSISIVYAAKPFNAYLIDYKLLTDGFERYGLALNAVGERCSYLKEKVEKIPVLITSEISSDKKYIRIVYKENDDTVRIQHIMFIDDWGSYTVRNEDFRVVEENMEDGYGDVLEQPAYYLYDDMGNYETSYFYNEYGDPVKIVFKRYKKDGQYEPYAIEYYEWTYADQKPLEVRNFFWLGAEKILRSTEVFVEWYE